MSWETRPRIRPTVSKYIWYGDEFPPLPPDIEPIPEEPPMGTDNGWFWFFSIGTLAVVLLGLAIYGMAHKTPAAPPITQGDTQ